MAFWDNIRFPYFNMQELNLDWIMTELKRIAGFMPQDGNVGDILTRKSDGAAWEPPEAVNININALPEDTQILDNDQLIFYDISAQANRKIKPPNMLDSMMSNGTPLMDGTASPGTSKKPARYDHKHPTDTSRQAALSGTQMNAVNSGAPANAFVNGVLKMENGGLGADNADDARINLGLATAYACAPREIGNINSDPVQISTTAGYAPLLFISDGPSTGRQSMYVIAVRGASTSSAVPVLADSHITVTANVGSVKIESSNTNCYGYIIPLTLNAANSITVAPAP